MKAENKSGKTIVDYADALVSFCAWCVKREYLPENPFRHLERPHAESGELRRALTVDEVRTLLDAASPERRLIYTVAILTGLRANELASLTPKHLDAESGGLLLDPKWTKNRKPGFTFLPPAVLDQLIERAGKLRPNQTLLGVPTHTARMLDEDLLAACIPKHTDEGKIDFHSLRTTFTTLVIEAGANPKEAQELARHSTQVLTMNAYARARGGRLREIGGIVAKAIGAE